MFKLFNPKPMLTAEKIQSDRLALARATAAGLAANAADRKAQDARESRSRMVVDTQGTIWVG